MDAGTARKLRSKHGSIATDDTTTEDSLSPMWSITKLCIEDQLGLQAYKERTPMKTI
jgi:hypothetical protein